MTNSEPGSPRPGACKTVTVLAPVPAYGAGRSGTEGWLVAMDDLDELGRAMGTLMGQGLLAHALGLSRLLADIQQDLMDISASLSIPMETAFNGNRTQSLDKWTRTVNAEFLQALGGVNPAGTLLQAQARIFRAMCREARRIVLALIRRQALRQQVRDYLARLAELLNTLEGVLLETGGVYGLCGE